MIGIAKLEINYPILKISLKDNKNEEIKKAHFICMGVKLFYFNLGFDILSSLKRLAIYLAPPTYTL